MLVVIIFLRIKLITSLIIKYLKAHGFTKIIVADGRINNFLCPNETFHESDYQSPCIRTFLV